MSMPGLNPSQLVADMASKLSDDLMKTVDRNMALLDLDTDKDIALLLVCSAMLDVLADRLLNGKRKPFLPDTPPASTINAARAVTAMEILHSAIEVGAYERSRNVK